MNEFEADEKYPTSFSQKDGSAAHLFSSANRNTVVRHFKWMRNYGIDGVFLQRFVSVLKSEAALRYSNTVLDNVRAGASQYGRTWALMYDLSGLQKGDEQKIMGNCAEFVDRLGITHDPCYQRHAG